MQGKNLAHIILNKKKKKRLYTHMFITFISIKYYYTFLITVILFILKKMF